MNSAMQERDAIIMQERDHRREGRYRERVNGNLQLMRRNLSAYLTRGADRLAARENSHQASSALAEMS